MTITNVLTKYKFKNRFVESKKIENKKKPNPWIEIQVCFIYFAVLGTSLYYINAYTYTLEEIKCTFLTFNSIYHSFCSQAYKNLKDKTLYIY